MLSEDGVTVIYSLSSKQNRLDLKLDLPRCDSATVWVLIVETSCVQAWNSSLGVLFVWHILRIQRKKQGYARCALQTAINFIFLVWVKLTFSCCWSARKEWVCLHASALGLFSALAVEFILISANLKNIAHLCAWHKAKTNFGTWTQALLSLIASK